MCNICATYWIPITIQCNSMTVNNSVSSSGLSPPHTPFQQFRLFILAVLFSNNLMGCVLVNERPFVLKHRNWVGHANFSLLYSLVTCASPHRSSKNRWGARKSCKVCSLAASFSYFGHKLFYYSLVASFSLF